MIGAPRLAAAALAGAALTALALSCTKVLGISDQVDVANRICTECSGQFPFLGQTPQECEDYLDGRLGAATDDQRALWLDRYERDCTTCDTVETCLYAAPVCKILGCTADQQCCTFPKGGSCNDAGRCL